MHLMTHLLMLIVVIGAIKWIRAAHCTRAAGNVPPARVSPRREELHGEVGDLRSRIATLERIAVDGRSSRALAAEIDALKD